MNIERLPIKRFETHITIAATDEQIAIASEYAANSGLKWTHIALDNGQFQSQPMLTFWGTGSFTDQQLKAEGIRQALESLGVRTVRIKVECDATDLQRLELDNDSLELQSGYFESHLKLCLSLDDDFERLRGLTNAHSARLSTNARRHFAGGFLEWFVTQRAYDSSAEVAANLTAELASTLKDHNYKIIETEQEYVLFDSNRMLDKGWL